MYGKYIREEGEKEMRGFIKCDICGKFYIPSENKRYDGLALFCYNSQAGGRTILDQNLRIVMSDGSDTDIPASIDMCQGCFDRFVGWAILAKDDAAKELK